VVLRSGYTAPLKKAEVLGVGEATGLGAAN